MKKYDGRVRLKEQPYYLTVVEYEVTEIIAPMTE